MESSVNARARLGPLDRVPPQNVEAERAVLGGVLLDPEAATKAVEIVSPESFYRPANARIFRAILSLFTRREPIDVMTLSEELGKSGDLEAIGGIAALTDLVDSTPSAANIEHYARIVLDKYILRQLIRASTEIAEDAFAADREADVILDASEQKIFKISESRVSQGFIHIKDILKERFDEIQRVHETRMSITGLPTGFVDLDAHTAGFHPSDLVIIAGRPSMGKTSFALNIAQHVALVEHRSVAIFSLEMSKEQLVQRLLCSEAQVDCTGAPRVPREGHRVELTNAAGLLSRRAHLHRRHAGDLDARDAREGPAAQVGARRRRSSSSTTSSSCAAASASENRQQEISAISRCLKALAKELSIPVIALSQLSRAVEARGGDRRPMLSDLRESGAIEQDADVVLFLYRPSSTIRTIRTKQGKAELIIGKQRNGPTGIVKLAFRADVHALPIRRRADEEPQPAHGAAFKVTPFVSSRQVSFPRAPPGDRAAVFILLADRAALPAGLRERPRQSFSRCDRIGLGSIPLVVVTSLFVGAVAAVQAAYQFQEYVPIQFLGTVVGKSVILELGPGAHRARRGGARERVHRGGARHDEGHRADRRDGDDRDRPGAIPRAPAHRRRARSCFRCSRSSPIFSPSSERRWSRTSPIGVSTARSNRGIKLLFNVSGRPRRPRKTFVFGEIIALMGCYNGFETRGGAEGVGVSTMQAVVSCVPPDSHHELHSGVAALPHHFLQGQRSR